MAKSKISNTELLPEEGVRQWFLGLLRAHGVEPYRIATEYPVEFAGRRLRVDIAVFALGGTDITMIVECKAPSVAISQKTVTQAFIYNSRVGARYVVLTNGAVTYIYDTVSCKFLGSIPSV